MQHSFLDDLAKTAWRDNAFSTKLFAALEYMKKHANKLVPKDHDKKEEIKTEFEDCACYGLRTAKILRFSGVVQHIPVKKEPRKMNSFSFTIECEYDYLG